MSNTVKQVAGHVSIVYFDTYYYIIDMIVKIVAGVLVSLF